MQKLAKLGIILVVLVSLLAPVSASRLKRETIQPIVFSVTPTSAIAGQTVLCTVTCDSTASVDTDISISASDSTLFSSLPSSVTVVAGHDSVSFYATLSNSASSFFVLSASASGTTVTSPPELVHM
jgi:hypothetical protein